MDDTTIMTHEGLDMTEAEIADLMADGERQATTEAEGDRPKEEAKSNAAATEPPKTKDEATKVEDKPPGDLRAALRASRRGEHRAREAAGRLADENKQLRAELDKRTAEAPKPPDEISEALEAFEADFPDAGKALRKIVANTKPAPAPAPVAQAPAPAPEFEPIPFDPETQDDIDSVEELGAWHRDPDQTNFDLARRHDDVLRGLSKWQGRPQAERFAEVVRRVKADTAAEAALATAPATSPPAKPRVNVKDAIANAPRAQPRTLADIGGGGDTPTNESSLGRYSGMSDDDIEADLMLG